MNQIQKSAGGFFGGGKAMVIAELGVNHDGEVQKAIELVHAASHAGADVVKLQVFKADRLMHPSSVMAEYQKRSLLEDSPIDMLRRYELEAEELGQIVGEIRKLGMQPLATPFSPEDVDVIESLELGAIKIASPDIVNWPLLRRAAQYGRPLLLSTGAANVNEISSSIAWLRGWNAQFALLHCISSYPTPAENVNLSWIAELAARFGTAVGFSDHTTDVITGAGGGGGRGVCREAPDVRLQCGRPGSFGEFEPKRFREICVAGADGDGNARFAGKKGFGNRAQHAQR